MVASSFIAIQFTQIHCAKFGVIKTKLHIFEGQWLNLLCWFGIFQKCRLNNKKMLQNHHQHHQSVRPSIHPSLTPSSILRQLFEKVSVHQKLINFILISLVFLTQPMMLFLFVFYTFQCCYCSARCVCECSFISVSVSRNITQQTLRGMRHLLVPACLIACQIIVIIDERVVVIFALLLSFLFVKKFKLMIFE